MSEKSQTYLGQKHLDITIIIVTYGRHFLLNRMLDSLQVAIKKTPDAKIEIQILINGTDQVTEDLLLKKKLVYSKTINALTPAAARNILLKKNNHEWVLFLDDDIIVPENFFLNFSFLTQKYPIVDVWGGPNTTPAMSNKIQTFIGWILAEKIIIGPMANRYHGTNAELYSGDQFNLMLCNLFVRKLCLENNNFGPHFKTAEENELLYKLTEQSFKLAGSKLLFVEHERRKNLRQFLRQIFTYGIGRGQLLFHRQFSSQIVFILSPILIAFLLSIAPWLLLVWLLLIQAHFAFKFKNLSLVLLILPAVIWLVYGVGILGGMTLSSKSAVKRKLIFLLRAQGL